jgi:hypothetical protein
VVWIALSVIIVSLLVLLGAVMSLAGRLRPLARAARRMRIRGEEATKLQAKLLALQEHVLEVQSSAEQASVRIQHDREVPLRRLPT